MRAYERLLQYVTFETTSREDAPEDTCPSSRGQTEFGAYLVEEMKKIGIADARQDEFGYIYGSIPANCEKEELPVIGLIAHMDTSPDASGKNVHPRIVYNYDGGDIVLNREQNVVMRAAQFERLAGLKGNDLLVTDGTTLLGADDKAGISEIMTAAAELISRNLPHGEIRIGFTPDEEIGRGADRFDVKGFGADFAYTVDGGALDEIACENFNAAGAHIAVKGVGIHPGDAKNKMRNASLLALEFHSMLPEAETPAHTEGYEGFYHLTHMEGEVEQASLSYIVRDHDRQKFEQRKQRLEAVAAYLNEKYGEGTFTLTLKDSYYNMKEKIDLRPEIMDRALRALHDAGVEAKLVPIRGGTDGARLSFMGLPCPNLPTGGENFHGRYEFVSLQAMDTMVEVLLNIVKDQKESE